MGLCFAFRLGMKKRIRSLLLVSASLIVVALLVTEWAYRRVENETDALLYNSVDAIPHRKTGVLLGCSPVLKSGYPNPYFTNRIQATADLYHAGKISNILVSGENSRADYDEPTAMKEALVAMGVPDSVIYLDYAGFRTIDSMIRAKEIFGRDSVTIISQPFHNRRALYIARHYGIEAVAYNARDLGGNYGLHQKLRERGARVKLFADLYLVRYSPHFLGKSEKMP